MKPRESQFEIQTYKEVNLIADPIHGYIHVTWPWEDSNRAETTEKDLIDSPWLQRLRRIHQLQAVWWVFPGGEHTRFQHSLGAMHLGGVFASHLYKSLRRTPGVDKSKPYVEEIMRLGGLLHDVGHGPFCHFFDEEYLSKNQIRDEQGRYVNHEILGQKIIREKLGETIMAIRRSPSGRFSSGDGQIEPDYLCYLISSQEEANDKMPKWLQVLKGLMTGVYTIDNLDYVWRDAYMCGILPKPIDVERIKHYTMSTKNGLALYSPAITALEEFLRFRFHMYFSVYYHRTVRAIELHMKEIFGETIELLYGGVNPYEDLDTFLSMDDWSVLCGVQKWFKTESKRRKALAAEWKSILDRQPTKWRCVHSYPKDYPEIDELSHIPASEYWEELVREQLGSGGSALVFKIDRVEEDPRRIDPLSGIADLKQVKIYNPAIHKIDSRETERIANRLPAKSIIFRLYAPRAQGRGHDQNLIDAFESAFKVGVIQKRGSPTST
jgi:HD superfamily phosphohydrolase